MSSSQLYTGPNYITPPKIRIQRASPDISVQFKTEDNDTGDCEPGTPTGLTPRRTKSLPAKPSSALGRPRHTRKRSASSAGLSSPFEEDDMSTRHSRQSSSSSKKQSSASSPCSSTTSSSSKKTKPSGKDIDWAEVTDPEERRRIQNRIAQRKFREKARDNKEKAERDSLNQEHAGNSYRIPLASDINTDQELPGLPWGSMNLMHMVSRGHEAESRRSSGRGTHVGDDGYAALQYGHIYGHGVSHAPSYGSSGGDDAYYDESAYLYDPQLQHYPSQ